MKPDDVLLSNLLVTSPGRSSTEVSNSSPPPPTSSPSSSLAAVVAGENSNSSGFFNLSAVVNSMNHHTSSSAAANTTAAAAAAAAASSGLFGAAGAGTASAGGNGVRQPDPQDLTNILMSSSSSNDLGFLAGTEYATDALLLNDEDQMGLVSDLTDFIRKDPTLSTLAFKTEDTTSDLLENGVPIPGSLSGPRSSGYEEFLSGAGSLTNASSSSLGGGPVGAFGPGSSAGSNVALSPVDPTATSPSLNFASRSSGGAQTAANLLLQHHHHQQHQQQQQQQQVLGPASGIQVKEELMDSSSSAPAAGALKLELDNELNVFTNDASKDVSLAFSTDSVAGPPASQPATPVAGAAASVQGSAALVGQQPASPAMRASIRAAGTPNELLFATSSYTTHSGGLTFSAAAKPELLLSSSVPTTTATVPHPHLFPSPGPAVAGGSSASPLSDILSDIPPLQQASNAGPDRHHHGKSSATTLHKLLLRNDPVGARPAQVRSPEASPASAGSAGSAAAAAAAAAAQAQAQAKAQRLRHRNALSASSCSLSKSAPVNPALWNRREPRPHISSVCSVNDSSLADEVTEVLNGISPSDLPDIDSEDEDAELGVEGDTSGEELDSDDDDISGSTPGGASGSAPKSGSKKERFFWQYNVQAKGPKGQKIVVETKIEDPHVFNDIVDPVFSGGVEMQGIKHSGKARRGDGNDLTPNPKKLAAIGQELEQLSKEINGLTPVSEMPFPSRCKSRKEKNKLASRACRLKKKAQHEANKVKCAGLENEHSMLLEAINRAKEILHQKVDPSVTRQQSELTQEMEELVKKQTKLRVAGHTTDYVNRLLEKMMKD